MADSVLASVGVGANLGDAQAAVRKAIQDLAALPQSELRAVSSLYASAPLDADGPDYVNAVVQLQTELSPQALLKALQAIEQQAGRLRPYRNAPRTLDLDILLYGDLELTRNDLHIPHPRMWQRAFVVIPLAEIAPLMVSSAQRAAVAGQSLRRLDA
ncbi:MAG: 2-amino-4-hydroxy-6-hydroxymethyldihydropteridine diphosphokinase [Betaproteobacteria bacterium]|nr:2-amino-4-hydroxy-6-hydroxymethyldihydropteridine diphosphokinase [Betaproteobacteria bacterium]